jgi:hypothetical protein
MDVACDVPLGVTQLDAEYHVFPAASTPTGMPPRDTGAPRVGEPGSMNAFCALAWATDVTMASPHRRDSRRRISPVKHEAHPRGVRCVRDPPPRLR